MLAGDLVCFAIYKIILLYVKKHLYIIYSAYGRFFDSFSVQKQSFMLYLVHRKASPVNTMLFVNNTFFRMVGIVYITSPAFRKVAQQ